MFNLALVAAAQTSSRSARLSNDENKTFARQERLASALHQRAVQEASDYESELVRLGTNMRNELVGKEFILAGEGDGCRGGTDDCRALPCKYDTISASDFDGWWRLRMNDFHAMEAVLDRDFASWNKERIEWRSRLEETINRAAPHESATTQWLARENAFYQENYGTVAWLGNFLWEMYAAEMTGLGQWVRDNDSRYDVEFLPQQRDGAFAPGMAHFGGVLQQMTDAADVRMAPLYQDVAVRLCEMRKATDQRIKITEMGDSLDRAEAALDKAAIAYEASRKRCRLAQEQERDRFAGDFLKARRELGGVRTRLMAKLNAWRKFVDQTLGSSGVGESVIAAAYPDGRELALYNSRVDAYLPFLSSHVQLTNSSAGATFPENSYGKISGMSFSIDDTCFHPEWWPYGATSVALDETEPTIKFPDIEGEPFNFVLDVKAALVQRGAAPGAAPDELP